MGDSLSCRRNTNDDDDAPPPPPPPLVPVGGQQQPAPPQPEYMSSQQVRTTRGQPSSSRNRAVADDQTRRGVNVGVRISSQPPALRPLNFMRFCATCNRRLTPQMDVYIFRGESAFCSPECRQVQMDAYARIQDIINS